MASPLRLRMLATLWVVVAMLAAFGASALWFGSSLAWRAHLTRAHDAGFVIYEALRTGTAPGLGIDVAVLTPEEVTLAEAGGFDLMAGAPRPAYVTHVSLKGADAGIQIGVVSDVLQYPVSDIGADAVAGAPVLAAAQLADLTRLFATYCSDPILFARYGTQDWTRVDGRAVWGCDVAPRDWRLPAALMAIVALAAIVTHIGNTTGAFEVFAQALRSRRRLGGPETYETSGPEELREIVEAVNGYLGAERAQLANRAVVLSSVSHDLGTPATRLRLRAALIEDAALRHKLEADIDSMTAIIDSVLTYTRAEMSVETPRQMSLYSLIESIVADYQDVGKSVSLRPPEDVIVQGGGSVFMSRRGHGVLSADRQVVVTARPVALERALTNLIDNALKYGRRADVWLETDADQVTIVVEDEGSESSAAQIRALLAPFTRGENTGYVDGHGLGLTIVDTIATLHGGALTFEDVAGGVRARFSIQRA